ncbi:PREDICTED: 39S ribosomal protein L53, mitochondrial, partial [Tauraco erythrolophus]|uniref:39S ribosomal protein L53, mitochondrial n=1 Tax=Tauraco erythrolophus TaxID=121530 RepID=UPI000523DC2E
KFLGYINHKKVQATNRNCEVTADVRHDGSEPLVDVMFADGERLIMKGANLTTMEMLTALGSRCNAKDLKEEQKSKKVYTHALQFKNCWLTAHLASNMCDQFPRMPDPATPLSVLELPSG